jgi:YidC/Oxa1 family membrane protein insertase
MEKRVILAFVLSFLVLYAFRALFTPPVPPPGEATQVPANVLSRNPANEQPSHSDPATELAPEEVRADKAEAVTVETPLYDLTFTNVGGLLKSAKLKKYTDGGGQPLELINQDAANKVGWPLGLATGDTALDEQMATAKFASLRGPNELVMEFAHSGIHVRKSFRFDSENYEFTVQTIVRNKGKSIPHTLIWNGIFGDQSIPQDPARRNAVYQADSTFKRLAVRSLKDQTENFATLRLGVEDQYFLAMFLFADNAVSAKVSKQEYLSADQKSVPTLMVAASVVEDKPIRVYVGPKQRDWLSKADPQLASVLDYGYFGFIAKPLVVCLLWIHSYVGNFGWSIILLTIVINLVLFPLRLKQQVAMLKMQKIQPQMRRLQDQYKKLKPNDPRRAQVQSEMMGLYKEHGVNPMGGCLPLLLQMPLLFGFYSALAYSIELRRAPWILWVKDLSQHDPYYVIPILMAIAMIVQQKVTPTTSVDPAQARMMMLMPLMMTFLFLSYASGLALYWLTGSVVGIGQQIFINKYWSPRAEAKLKARSKPGEARGAP